MTTEIKTAPARPTRDAVARLARSLKAAHEAGTLPAPGQPFALSRAQELAARLTGHRDWREVSRLAVKETSDANALTPAQAGGNTTERHSAPGRETALDWLRPPAGTPAGAQLLGLWRNTPQADAKLRGKPRWIHVPGGRAEVLAELPELQEACATALLWAVGEAVQGRAAWLHLNPSMQGSDVMQAAQQACGRAGIPLRVIGLGSGQLHGLRVTHRLPALRGPGSRSAAVELAVQLLGEDEPGKNQPGGQSSLERMVLANLLSIAGARGEDAQRAIPELLMCGPGAVKEYALEGARISAASTTAVLEIKLDQLAPLCASLAEQLQGWDRGEPELPELDYADWLAPGTLTLALEGSRHAALAERTWQAGWKELPKVAHGVSLGLCTASGTGAAQADARVQGWWWAAYHASANPALLHVITGQGKQNASPPINSLREIQATGMGWRATCRGGELFGLHTAYMEGPDGHTAQAVSVDSIGKLGRPPEHAGEPLADEQASGR